MHNTLKTYSFENKVFEVNEQVTDILRDFVSENTHHIARFYPADYSNATPKAIMTMLGFSLQYVSGSRPVSKFRVLQLTCYDKDFEVLHHLVDQITEG